MGHDARLRQVRAAAVVLPVRQGRHPHQHIPPALLARLDDVALQLVPFGLAGMDHAAGGAQRHQRRDAQLGQLLHQELRPVALRQRRRHLDPEADLPRRRGDGLHVHDHFTAAHGAHLGGVFVAVAVEQANPVAGADPANGGQVVRLGPVDHHLAGRQGTVDVKSIRHPC